ncbi:hypothetical protein [Leifsonia poae]|uniref:hypothetical protein n=1 Tax=Leifsonia poae TaxID=110933 RepID=UPI001CBC5FA7|nr:hypothetical protein [Leifsonia poae]
MSCSGADLTCEVARVADALSGFDWDGFTATLLATIVGAAVAALVSIYLYRHELRTRRRGDVDAGVVALIRAIQAFTRDYAMFQSTLKARAHQSLLAVKNGWDERIVVTPEPDRAELDTAVEALVVMTNKKERVVAERVRQVLYELNFIKDAEQAALEFHAVRRVLVAWRATKRSDEETIRNLNVIDARRQILEQGTDTALPAPPEPYVRTPFTLAE